MSDIREVYSKAANKAVTEDERYGLWRVFGYYRVRELGDGDARAVADRTVPRDVKPQKGPKSPKYTKQDGSVGRARRLNVSEYYMPLVDRPDLFDRFARLAERGEVDRKTWLDWLHEYGTLKNDITDMFSNFVREALLANRTLRLFEAVANPSSFDSETTRKLLIEEYDWRGDKNSVVVERASLYMLKDMIEQKVRADCYPILLPRDVGKWRKKKMSPLAREWGFDSLLGAMWLQFMWLTTTDGLRYCKNPDCRKPIPPYRRSDAETCGPACRKAFERSKK